MSSATTRALRTSLRRAASCSRYASSQASPSPSSSSSRPSKLDVKPKATLPAEKMRILTSLYHQSESFITKENLSDAIDDAFIYRHEKYSSHKFEGRMVEVAVDVAAQEDAPKYTPETGLSSTINKAAHVNTKDVNKIWSSRMSPREMGVAAVLYGVEEENSAQPGYDLLMDKYEEVKAQIEEEKAARGEEGQA